MLELSEIAMGPLEVTIIFWLIVITACVCRLFYLYAEVNGIGPQGPPGPPGPAGETGAVGEKGEDCAGCDCKRDPNVPAWHGREGVDVNAPSIFDRKPR